MYRGNWLESGQTHAGDHFARTMSATDAKTETPGQMKQRHKLELRSLQNEIKAVQKSAKKEKLSKKDVEAKVKQMEEDMKQRHEKELASFQEEETPAADSNPEPKFAESEAPSEPKATKAQRRRENKKKQERERRERIEEANKDVVSERQIEADIILAKLSQFNLAIRDIPSDGHCMYHAVADQMKQHNVSIDSQEPAYQYLRQVTSSYMRAHPDEFIPFLVLDEDSAKSLSQLFEEYCDRVANSSDWGGQLELRALSSVLENPIHVFNAESDVIVMGDEFAPRQPLQLTYHLHYYTLGEHFNSVEPVKAHKYRIPKEFPLRITSFHAFACLDLSEPRIGTGDEKVPMLGRKVSKTSKPVKTLPPKHTTACRLERRPPLQCHTEYRLERLTSLDLEATALSATTSTFELAALRAHVWLDTAVGVDRLQGRLVAEVLVHFTGRAAATEEDRVGATWGTQSELIEGQAFTASVGDASTGSLGEAESGDRELWHIDEAEIIGDWANDNGDLAIVGLHRATRAIDIGAWRRKTMPLNFEFVRRAKKRYSCSDGNSNVSKKSPCDPNHDERFNTYTNEQVQVDIFRLWRGAVLVTDNLATGNKIDALFN
ncbi:TPA: LOW QUALITY PROTEIN: hypothetical protein N0F65_002342 [Lagenidium giganteum]|uniref:OTU domain-containing protein n=1 Tax=Lagenidium giganteum TaxID=4803 RepID=A0AAV2Z3G8_9STRA|nr:TPA: LOW QUALITY PROTEIN: hypothetical protein N0F65_002342 [Lagenidium giganteum]